MDRRPQLHQLLKSLFNGTPHVYHQRPSKGEKLEIPCIVYKMVDLPDKFADNNRYFEHREWELTVIDSDPDSKLREKVAQLKWCRFNRPYVADNLNHFVFTLNY